MKQDSWSGPGTRPRILAGILAMALYAVQLTSALTPAFADHNHWDINNIVYLCGGTGIYHSSDTSQPPHTRVPHDDWPIRVIGPHRGDWTNVKRDDGGSGWVQRSEADSCKHQNNNNNGNNGDNGGNNNGNNGNNGDNGGGIVGPAVGVTLYEHDNAGGRGENFDRDARRLSDHYISNDSASWIVVPELWEATVCEHDDYQGTCTTFSAGTYRLGNYPIGNDRASSIRVRQLTPPPPPKAGRFTLLTPFTLPARSGAGQPVSTTLEIKNIGDLQVCAAFISVAGLFTPTGADRSFPPALNVCLNGGEQRILNFSRSFAEPGVYDFTARLTDEQATSDLLLPSGNPAKAQLTVTAGGPATLAAAGDTVRQAPAGATLDLAVPMPGWHHRA